MFPTDHDRSRPTASLLQVNSVAQISALRHGAHVQRYHTARTLITETNAAHSHGVALLCAILFPTQVTLRLLIAALCHDLQEGITGDLPHTVKRDAPALLAAYAEAEETARWTLGLSALDGTLSPDERALLRAADLADAFFFGLEEHALGNRLTGATIMQNCMRAFESDAMRTILPAWFLRDVTAQYARCAADQ